MKDIIFRWGRLFLPLALWFSVLLIYPLSARAGYVEDIAGTSGDGELSLTIDSGDEEGIPDFLNNDNSTGLGNVNPGTGGLSLDSLGTPFDLTFQIVTSGGTTEYLITETVTNNTLVPWTGYKFITGFGSGALNSTDFPFVQSNGLDSLDFDTPDNDPVPTSTLFGSLAHDPDMLTWSNGLVGIGQTTSFTFSIDVPDFNVFMPADTETNRGYLATLRQGPTAPGANFIMSPISQEIQSTAVPEPATLFLLASGFSGLLFSRRKKQEASLS